MMYYSIQWHVYNVYNLLLANDPPLKEVLHHNVHGASDVDLVGADVDLGLCRRLVRCADTGELLDLARTGLLVQPLWVALLHDAQRRVDEDLDERQGRVVFVVQRACEVTVGRVGRDERRQRQRAGGREEEGDFADAADLASASHMEVSAE